MKKVYFVSNLNEVDTALKENEKWSFSLALKYIFIKLEIWFKNIILLVLKFIWFSSKLPPKESVKTIVVYSVGILGDNAVRLPAIASLKQTYPNSRLVVINKYQNWNSEVPKQLFSYTDYIDEVILVKKNPVQREGYKFVYDDSATKDLTCDLFVNLSPLGARGWFGAVVREMIFAKQLKARYADTFKMNALLKIKGVQPVLHRISDLNYPRFPEMVLQNFEVEVDYDQEIFSNSTEVQNSIVSKLNNVSVKSEYVVLHPGSALPCQRWPTLRYAEIAKYLNQEYGLKSVVTGVNNEKEMIEELAKKSDGSAISFAGITSLSETIELVKKSKMVISNDTGLLHLATVQNIPTIGIFGTRENPKWWFPLGIKKYILFSFSQDSLRYNDENIITDLLQIQTEDVKYIVDRMLNELDKG